VQGHGSGHGKPGIPSVCLQHQLRFRRVQAKGDLTAGGRLFHRCWRGRWVIVSLVEMKLVRGPVSLCGWLVREAPDWLVAHAELAGRTRDGRM
jgi:hypothetical protein